MAGGFDTLNVGEREFKKIQWQASRMAITKPLLHYFVCIPSAFCTL
jgi:hypothetical protein